jgi:hypothetical protein
MSVVQTGHYPFHRHRWEASAQSQNQRDFTFSDLFKKPPLLHRGESCDLSKRLTSAKNWSRAVEEAKRSRYALDDYACVALLQKGRGNWEQKKEFYLAIPLEIRTVFVYTAAIQQAEVQKKFKRCLQRLVNATASMR